MWSRRSSSKAKTWSTQFLSADLSHALLPWPGLVFNPPFTSSLLTALCCYCVLVYAAPCLPPPYRGLCFFYPISFYSMWGEGGVYNSFPLIGRLLSGEEYNEADPGGKPASTLLNACSSNFTNQLNANQVNFYFLKITKWCFLQRALQSAKSIECSHCISF